MWTIFAVALAKKTALYVVGRVSSSDFIFPPCSIQRPSPLTCYQPHLPLQSYGFPRVYRRLLEFNRRTIADRTSRRVIQERVKYFFRIPNKIGRGLGMRYIGLRGKGNL